MRDILVTILGLAALICATTSCDDDDGSTNVDFTTVAVGHSEEYPGLDDDTTIDRMEMVIRTPTAWQGFWSAIDDTAPPEIDFAGEMVIVVTSGRASSDETEVEIRAVYEKDGNYSVSVTERYPKDDFSQYLVDELSDDVVPYHIIRLPRTDGVVKFKYTYVEEDEDDERVDSLFPPE